MLTLNTFIFHFFVSPLLYLYLIISFCICQTLSFSPRQVITRDSCLKVNLLFVVSSNLV
uniref:Uncharacterized protein n=1 Tax=Siphoviridae sp. ctZCK1 TaxID=2826382 RepID=A0A8S5MB84_9CAUD|nr:MAG TPA: hypothetical protein [Siphoviridae sp. ctZCK1]